MTQAIVLWLLDAPPWAYAALALDIVLMPAVGVAGAMVAHRLLRR